MNFEVIDPVLASYLKKRKKPTSAEIRLFLREVNYHCPICGKELQSRRQKKLDEKLFQIAHIYPNSPTEEQYYELKGLKRLGDNSESFENRIALCKNCHGTQDFHTTKEEYLELVTKKEECLKKMELEDATNPLGLETEIETVIGKVVKFRENDIQDINYKVVSIDKKFEDSDLMLKSKIRGYLLIYFAFVRDTFENISNNTLFDFDILSGQIRACFKKMDNIGATKTEIFDAMVEWLNNRTGNISRNACEVIISFFVQECDVFDEITK